MIENKLTYLQKGAWKKKRQGLGSIKANPNMPEPIKDYVINQGINAPTPITGYPPRG